MKYVMIFHANLNYAYLTPDKYEFVIRKSYELIFDTMAKHFPKVKYVFEASGYTLDQIAARCPDVLQKLKAATASGQCEFMGSPYAHPMLPNFPEEDGVWSIRFSNETYKRLLGFVPKSFWNPECGWRDYVPRQVMAAGYQNVIGDFEAYSRSCACDGKPLRPEIYEKEHAKEKAFYHFGFKYDLPGNERAIHFPFDKIAGVADGKMRMFLRTDRIAQFGVRHFMGMKGYSFENYMKLIRKYSEQNENEPEGAVIIFADDAEYIGTNGWFRLKYQNRPDNTFEHTPDSGEKLIKLVGACRKIGGFCTFDEACRLSPLKEKISFDDDSACHGGHASTWAETPMAKLLRPWQDLVRKKLIKAVMPEKRRRLCWLHLTNSYNSDGQWPPTLPDAPHIVHPFNYDYCYQNLLMAEMLVGGVDRGRLDTRPADTVRNILAFQQDMILKKAKELMKSKNRSARSSAEEAVTLIECSRNLESIGKFQKVLAPSEYTTRAEALVKSRRLVGGVEIEVVQDMKGASSKKR